MYETYKRPPSWIYNLAEHHPDLREALEHVRMLNAAKIANHCFEGDKNSAFGEKILPMYCKEYKELLKWKAEIAKHSNEEIGDIIVKVMSFKNANEEKK